MVRYSFNDSNISQGDSHDQVDGSQQFANFGAGYDLYGGYSTLGTQQGVASSATAGGHSYGGDTALFQMSGPLHKFDVIGLESFVFSNAQVTTSVPESSSLAIFALGIMGLASRRFKKK